MSATQITEADWGYLVNKPENISSEDAQAILERIAQGMLVIAEVTKRTHNKNRLATDQNWTDLDGKLPCSFEYVENLYLNQMIYDFTYETPPTGYLGEVNGRHMVVMTDGNHRTATAISMDVPIGVRLVEQRVKKRVYPFSIILSPIRREVDKINY